MNCNEMAYNLFHLQEDVQFTADRSELKSHLSACPKCREFVHQICECKELPDQNAPFNHFIRQIQNTLYHLQADSDLQQHYLKEAV